MTAFHLVRLECDRCGTTAEVDEDSGAGTGWVHIGINLDWYRTTPGVSGPGATEDLCPGCFAGLREWLDAGEPVEDVDEPSCPHCYFPDARDSNGERVPPAVRERCPVHGNRTL